MDSSDVQAYALLDEIEAIEAEILRLRLRSRKALRATAQYFVGVAILGLIASDTGVVLACVALGSSVGALAALYGRRKIRDLARRRDELIEAGSLLGRSST